MENGFILGNKLTPGLLLVDVEDLKRESYLDANVNNDEIRIAITDIQNMLIKRILGSCLYDQLNRLICNCLINECHFKHHKILLDQYLFPIFRWGVLAELALPLTYKIRNNGIIKINTDTSTTATMDELIKLRQEYYNKRDKYILDAINYICCHSKYFKNLCCCQVNCCCGITALHKDFKTGLNLECTPKKSYHYDVSRNYKKY